MARRHESLIPLSHEHHDALLLAWRLRTGDLSKREPELRVKHVSTFFEYRLVNHLRLEEELLFPAFRAVLGVEASLIDVLLSDHRELRAKAAAIKAGAHDQVDARPPMTYIRLPEILCLPGKRKREQPGESRWQRTTQPKRKPTENEEVSHGTRRNS